MDSRDMIQETLLFLRAHELPACCLVNVTWAETSRPLLVNAMQGNIAAGVCTQRLIIEAGLMDHSFINASMAPGGRLHALSSAVKGDGKLRSFPPGTAHSCDATTTALANLPSSSNDISGDSGDSGGGGDDGITESDGSRLKNRETRFPRSKAAATTTFDFADGQQLIGFSECVDRQPGGGVIVFGVAVGESLGCGAALHSWREKDNGCGRDESGEESNGSSLHAASTLRPTSVVKLEFSEMLCGPNALAAVAHKRLEGSERSGLAISEADKALFKCRGFHCLPLPARLPSEGSVAAAAGDESSGLGAAAHKEEEAVVQVVRALVHNATLASQKKALVCAWSSLSGELLPQHCAVLDWQPQKQQTTTTTTTTTTTQAQQQTGEAQQTGVGSGDGGERGEVVGTAVVNKENDAPPPSPASPPLPNAADAAVADKIKALASVLISVISCFSRFGGVSSACVSVDTTPWSSSSSSSSPPALVLVTGHDRDECGVAKVRVWEGLSGRLLGSLEGARGLPTEGLSVAGVTQVCASGEWVVAACTDGKAHVWQHCRKVALLGSNGEVAACVGDDTGGASQPNSGGLSHRDGGGVGGGGRGQTSRPSSSPDVCQAVAISGGFAVAAFATPWSALPQTIAEIQSSSTVADRRLAAAQRHRRKHVGVAVFRLCGSAPPPTPPSPPPPEATASALPTLPTAAPAVEFLCELPVIGVAMTAAAAAVVATSVVEDGSDDTAPGGVSGGDGVGRDGVNGQPSSLLLASATTTTTTTTTVPSTLNTETNAKTLNKKLSVLGGDLRVNKICCDLTRRGKIVVACSSAGAHRGGAAVNGFLAEYDFLNLER